MKIGAPTILLFLVSLALEIVGLIGHFRPDLIDPEIARQSLWFMIGGYGVLVLGALFRGQ
jgi:hypothetical protein